MSQTQEMIYGLCTRCISVSDEELIAKFFVTLRNRVIANITKIMLKVAFGVIGAYIFLCLITGRLVEISSDLLMFFGMPCGMFALILLLLIIHAVFDDKKQQKLLSEHADEILASDPYVFNHINMNRYTDMRIETINFTNKNTGEELDYGMIQPEITYDEMSEGGTYRFYALDKKHILVLRVI